MTNPEIETARAELTAATAEVERLQAKLRGAMADQASRGESGDEDKPQRLGWSDGVAAARARYPQGNGTGTAPDADEDHTDEPQRDTTAEAGRAEARRRAAARGSA